MSTNLDFINPYFARWRRDVSKARELLDTPRFYLEAWLVLSCHIGALASLRFPSLRDGDAYVKTVLHYSGRKDFYEQIDLLFLFQWPRSKLRDHGTYRSMKNHTEIVAALQRIYGPEDELKSKVRYVAPSILLSQAIAAKVPDFDEKNFCESLPLFSLAEELYRYVRCDAVHNGDFPLINERAHLDGSITYENNHVITGDVLYSTVEGVVDNLHTECVARERWPHEL